LATLAILTVGHAQASYVANSGKKRGLAKKSTPYLLNCSLNHPILPGKLF
jgi:hypothetical protein